MTSPRVIYFGIRPQKSAAEVGGWSKVDQMGLKDALTYDTATRKYRNYTKSQIINLIESLQTADLIVGFNQLNFDYKILSTYTDTDLEALPNFDMLSRIEQTLNFRVSRDNLAHNTLENSKNSKSLSTLENRVGITKKLFAHGCKEGYLSYHNSRFRKKEVCNTSSWADTARSLTEKKQSLSEIVVLSESDIAKTSPTPINTSQNSEYFVAKPQDKPITQKLDLDNVQDKNQHHHTTEGHTVETRQFYHESSGVHRHVTEQHIYNRMEQLFGPTISFHQFVEARRLYHESRDAYSYDTEQHAYDKWVQLFGHVISFHQFMVAIGQLHSWYPRNKSNYKTGDFRYYYIDRSGTIAFERVNDYVDIRNIREELARGI